MVWTLQQSHHSTADSYGYDEAGRDYVTQRNSAVAEIRVSIELELEDHH
jgi:hypothetical protein